MTDMVAIMMPMGGILATARTRTRATIMAIDRIIPARFVEIPRAVPKSSGRSVMTLALAVAEPKDKPKTRANIPSSPRLTALA